jgi:hypothetical protein
MTTTFLKRFPRQRPSLDQTAFLLRDGRRPGKLAPSCVRHRFEVKCKYVRALQRNGPANRLFRPL